MIDIILLVFVIAVFAAGFWCGGRYNTYTAMFDTFVEWTKTIRKT